MRTGQIKLPATWKVTLIISPWPRVHKAFQNLDQDQAQVKHSLLWTFFETYNNYLTIDCWYLIKYVLQTRHLGILSFVYERKGDFL